MKLGVSLFAYDEGRSGISMYMNQCLLFYNGSEEDVLFFIPKYEYEHLPLEIKKGRLKFIVLNTPKSKVLELLITYFVLPILFVLNKRNVAFFPAGNRRLSFCPFVKVITTFHDLSQFHIKSKYGFFRMIYIKRIVPLFLKRVDQIFAISKSTKQDIVNFFNIGEDKIELNYNGFEASLKGKCESKVDEILYVSRIEHPGKNHINLIKAFHELPLEIKSKYKLIFAGKEWSGAEVVKKAILSYGLEDKVILTGFLNSEELASCYSRARLFVHPSLFEGFGLPLLEAMNNNLNICASNISVFKEVCGEEVSYFDPEDSGSIKSSIETILSKEIIPKDYSHWLARFDWNTHFFKIHNACKAQVVRE